MSQKTSKGSKNLANRTDENQYEDNNERNSRKRKAADDNSEAGELPSKISRPNPTRKRKAQDTPALEDISNKLDDDYQKPTKISRKASDLNNNNEQEELKSDTQSTEDPHEELLFDDIIESPPEFIEILSPPLSDADTDEPQSQPLSDIDEPENNFDKLCTHDIIEIIEKLPFESRLTLAATSKRFNQVLIDNPNRLPIKLNLNFDTEDFPTLERVYRNIKIRNLTTPETDDRSERVMKVFNQLKKGVYDVKVFRSNITSKFLHDVLQTMPQISSFYVGSSTAVDKLQFNEEPLTLSKLKKVTVHHRNVQGMGAILAGVTTLEEFVFKSQDDEEDPEPIVVIENFDIFELDDDSDEEEGDNVEEEVAAIEQIIINPLHNTNEVQIELMTQDINSYIDIKATLKRQKNLKVLEFSNSYIFETPFNDCEFQLKHLIFFVPWATNKQLTNIRDFLMTQNQLESVVINVLCSESKENREVLGEMLTYVMELKKLKTFKVVFYSGLQMIEFFRDSRIVCPNLKELYLGLVPCTLSHRRVIEAIVRHFPNLTKLEISNDPSWLTQANAETFAPLSELSLEMLRMENVLGTFLHNLRIPTLKFLHLRNVLTSNRDNWQQFYTNNPNLEVMDFHFNQNFQPDEVVPFVQDITQRLNRIRLVHACMCGRLVNEDERQQILEAFTLSRSFKRISFCGWILEKA